MRADAHPETPESRHPTTPVRAETPEFPESQARRPHRRVTTEAVPGTDPTPAPEPSRSSGTENDARLKADKPPHWG